MDADRAASVAGHHGSADLKHRVLQPIVESGLPPDSLRPDDLGPVDEFHMRGRAETAEIVARAGLGSPDRVPDIGSGPGGVVRFPAPERVPRRGFRPHAGLGRHRQGPRGAERAPFLLGTALSLPFPDDAFDAALPFPTGMNPE